MEHFSPEDGLLIRVEETGALLRRYFFLKKALLRIGAGWLPSLRTFKQKGDLARHIYLDARAMESLSLRLWELSYGRRDPFADPSGLQTVMDHVTRAQDYPEFLVGVYLTVKSALVHTIRQHLERTDPIFDWPTIDVLKPILERDEEQLTWTRDQLNGMMLPAAVKRRLADWERYIEQELAQAGGVSGSERPDPGYEAPVEFVDRPPYQLPDEITFDDMPTHSFDSDPGSVPPDYHMVYAYYQEIDIVDLIATMVWDSPPDMPVAYYVDFCRQMWDEVRHTTMGIRRLHELGIDLKNCGCPTGRYAAWRKMTLLERMGWLTQVGEACSLAGKRDHIKKYLSNGDVVSAAQIEYDIADESSHVRFGSKWIPELLKKDGDPRTKAQVAKDGHRAFRMLTADLRRRLGMDVPEGYLAEFEGCEDVRDPARSF